MLDKYIIRKFTLADCQEYKEATKAELALTGLRLSQLLTTQAKNPEWAAYDKYADDVVGIDIRIEEQEAVLELLEDVLALIAEREAALKGRGEYPAHEKTLTLKHRPEQPCLF